MDIFLRMPYFQYRVRHNPSVATILGRKYPVHVLSSHMFKMHFNCYLCLPNGLSLSSVPTTTLRNLLLFYRVSVSTANLIHFDGINVIVNKYESISKRCLIN
jgi:hypothetical protein